MTIIALAGRRIDVADAEPRRFPLDDVPMVRERIYRLFLERKAEVLVSSAACGADLLALEEAARLGIRRRIILPFDRARFRAESVTDRPGDWGPLFDRMCDEAVARGDLVILNTPGPASAGYEAVIRMIVHDALALARQKTWLPWCARRAVQAVVVWDGLSRGQEDFSASFMVEARSRRLPITEVRTR